MTIFERLHIPSLGGATEWLNSEPLGPAELRGHVVLVNFWTLTCINWLRTEPYVRAWSRWRLLVAAAEELQHEQEDVQDVEKDARRDRHLALLAGATETVEVEGRPAAEDHKPGD
jgi:hypothetical protein